MVAITYLSLLLLLLPRRVFEADPVLRAMLKWLQVKSYLGLRLAAVVFLAVMAMGAYVFLATQ